MGSTYEIVDKFCKRFFSLFDLNNDGKVVKDHIMGYLWRLTMETVPTDNFIGMFNRMNTDDHGKSSYEDFLAVFSNPNRGQEHWASSVFENIKYFISLLSDEDIDYLLLDNNMDRVAKELWDLISECEQEDFAKVPASNK